ncbi:response regulator transcription factor [Bifidobacterium bombi]|uniref:Two-component transcriptional regulator, LuxR family n=1 Tax=Bifidobacterium bombi DSM 19703 TaxID=1341695 RepID=A0A080N389_9BIFI|nr:response regulator transcription factor [Bifidobacterium bombi]KFF31577.1 two-component transcriptional regulator, LuxR family [Bifidobacterium bombi DSM 19703]
MNDLLQASHRFDTDSCDAAEADSVNGIHGEVEGEFHRPIRVSIADDDPAICQLMEQILTTSSNGTIRVASTSTDGAAAVEHAREEHPDVVLMDIAMRPGMDGITATRLMQDIKPKPHILIFTALGPTDNVQRAIEAGADGFISKAGDISELIGRITDVCHGDPQFDMPSQRQIIHDLHHDQPRTRRDEARKLLDSLTNREREIALLVGQDCSNAEIANKLYISESSEKKTLTSACNRLGMSRVQLAQLVAVADFDACDL